MAAILNRDDSIKILTLICHDNNLIWEWDSDKSSTYPSIGYYITNTLKTDNGTEFYCAVSIGSENIGTVSVLVKNNGAQNEYYVDMHELYDIYKDSLENLKAKIEHCDNLRDVLKYIDNRNKQRYGNNTEYNTNPNVTGILQRMNM